MDEPIRVALALGGGGARGYAHIGVIQVLQERGYEIVGISGCSMGALIGGLHAAGQLPAYTDWVSALTQRDVLRLLDPSLKARGAIRGDKVMARVRDLLDGRRIEDLDVPFTAVATDLFNRKEVWFQQGPADAAIRASIALPSFIPPVMLNGRLLADGGLMNPIPITPLAALHADATVAVFLAGEPEDHLGKAPVRESAEPRPVDEWRERFRRGAARVLDRETTRRLAARFGSIRGSEDLGAVDLPIADVTQAAFGELPRDLGFFDVLELSLDALQSVVNRYRLAGYPPDVLVTVPKNACRTLDFHRGAEMIELGRTLAEQALAGANLSRTE